MSRVTRVRVVDDDVELRGVIPKTYTQWLAAILTANCPSNVPTTSHFPCRAHWELRDRTSKRPGGSRDLLGTLLRAPPGSDDRRPASDKRTTSILARPMSTYTMIGLGIILPLFHSSSGQTIIPIDPASLLFFHPFLLVSSSKPQPLPPSPHPTPSTPLLPPLKPNHPILLPFPSQSIPLNSPTNPNPTPHNLQVLEIEPDVHPSWSEIDTWTRTIGG